MGGSTFFFLFFWGGGGGGLHCLDGKSLQILDLQRLSPLLVGGEC